MKIKNRGDLPQLKIETMKKLSHVFYWLLCGVIRFQINNGLFENKNLKKGQLVKYNWKAKVKIKSAIRDNIHSVMKVKGFDGSIVEFTNDDSCDPFWVRKLHWWER